MKCCRSAQRPAAAAIQQADPARAAHAVGDATGRAGSESNAGSARAPGPTPVATPAEPRKAPAVNSLDELDLLASMIDPPKAPPPKPAQPAPAAAPATANPAPPAGADMDMLEEEMARLLGRPGTPKAP